MSEVADRLHRLARDQKLPPGMLFIGGGHESQRTTGLALAAQLVCLAEPNEQPCQICSACRKVFSLTHPDVRLIEPEKKELRIEQVRQLQRWLYIGPHEASRKVALLDQAETLNRAAANALLKTLEEPPPHATLILLARSVESLLPTMVSRLQRFRFPLPEETESLPDPPPAWLNDLQLLLEGRLSVGASFALTLSEQIEKERESLPTFFRILENELCGKMLAAHDHHSKQNYSRQLDRLFDLTQTTERELLTRYANVGLGLNNLLLHVWETFRPSSSA